MIEVWQFLLGSYLVSWVLGFALGFKLRVFKQAVEVISS